MKKFNEQNFQFGLETGAYLQRMLLQKCPKLTEFRHHIKSKLLSTGRREFYLKIYIAKDHMTNIYQRVYKVSLRPRDEYDDKHAYFDWLVNNELGPLLVKLSDAKERYTIPVDGEYDSSDDDEELDKRIPKRITIPCSKRRGIRVFGPKPDYTVLLKGLESDTLTSDENTYVNKNN